MGLVEKVTSVLTGEGRAGEPSGAVHVVDPSSLNWLYITYNTVEELVRVNENGTIKGAAMSGYNWADDLTFEVDLREGERFPDGEPLTTDTVKRSFDEAMRGTGPHPPGTHFNIDPRTSCEVTGERSLRFHLPEPDGLILGKLRAYHIMSTQFWIMSTQFWKEIGFGYRRNGNGEGHW